MQTTLPRLYWPLMEGPSVVLDHCAICGRAWPLNSHHIVRRSDGKLFRDGVEVPKPTITLCGSGNTSGCHGLAHQNRLHFRYEDGEWQYAIFQEPIKYQRALEEGEWKPLPRLRGWQ